MPGSRHRLLTFNAHEAYVYSLTRIGYQWDIIDYLPGRYTGQWDTNVRPVPDNARLISVDQALASGDSYLCAIAHSISDLLLIKTLQIPKILVIHVSLTGYMAVEGSKFTPQEVARYLNTYLDKIRGVAVSVSRLKQESWGVTGPIIPFYIDGDFFRGYSGEIAAGLRVANQIAAKKLLLNWSLHREIAKDFPVQIVGHNPDMPGVREAASHRELRSFFRSHRFYLHTAHPEYEDGYNTASLEAMATGMPVVCNAHPSAPIENGVNGFVSDDVQELREGIRRLLADRDLAEKMGRAARESVVEQHSLERFRALWNEAIELAVRRFQSGTGRS